MWQLFVDKLHPFACQKGSAWKHGPLNFFIWRKMSSRHSSSLPLPGFTSVFPWGHYVDQRFSLAESVCLRFYRKSWQPRCVCSCQHKPGPQLTDSCLLITQVVRALTQSNVTHTLKVKKSVTSWICASSFFSSSIRPLSVSLGQVLTWKHWLLKGLLHLCSQI